MYHPASSKDPWDLWERERHLKALPACEEWRASRMAAMRRMAKLQRHRLSDHTYCHKSEHNIAQRKARTCREVAPNVSRLTEHSRHCDQCSNTCQAIEILETPPGNAAEQT